MAVDQDIQAVEKITAALNEIRAAGSTRIEVRRGAKDISALPGAPRLRSPASAVRRFAGWVVNAAAAAQDAEGVLDLDHRRYMVDYGAYAVLCADGEEWGGRSGRALSTLPSAPSEQPVPFWLFDLLDGVRWAAPADRQEVRGASCRRYPASVARGHAATVLPRDWLEAGSDLPIEVWIDDRYIRRIRVVAAQRTWTLDLWDFGVDVNDLDWTRLPVVRSLD
jgi:hypothetical protein